MDADEFKPERGSTPSRAARLVLLLSAVRRRAARLPRDSLGLTEAVVGVAKILRAARCASTGRGRCGTRRGLTLNLGDSTTTQCARAAELKFDLCGSRVRRARYSRSLLNVSALEYGCGRVPLGSGARGGCIELIGRPRQCFGKGGSLGHAFLTRG